MANITRKEEGGELHRRAGGRPFWDPFGMFSALPALVDPFGGLAPSPPARTFTPAFDVHETPDAYVFEADLPGIKEDEFEVSVNGKQLSVRGKRQSTLRSENERYSCAERAYGSFERTFTLSDDAQPENANAEFRDGVLFLEVPKRAKPEARRVPLSGVQSGKHRRSQQEMSGEATPGGGEESARTREARRSVRRRHRRKR